MISAQAGVNNFEGAMEEHAEYRDAYRSRFKYDTASWPKVVFLYSFVQAAVI